MIYELPNYVCKEDLNAINEAIDIYVKDKKNLHKKPDTYRHGDTIAISQQPSLNELDKLVYKICNSLNSFVVKNYRPTLPHADMGYEFHRYYPGDICNVHSDSELFFANNTNTALIRFLSVVIHLNTPIDGGDIVFPEQNKIVKTEAGKVVLFPPYGFVPHYTTPSSSNRDVIVTWLVYGNVNAIKT